MDIESKIRLKAIGLYVVAGVAAALIVLFLYNTRNNIAEQRANIDSQHHVFALTNKLVYAVGDAQLSISMFVSTHDERYITEFQKKLVGVNALIDTISAGNLSGKYKLQQIRGLLSKQVANILALNRQLGHENPLASITKRITQYKPQEVRPSRTITVKQDTVYKPEQRKSGFFKRLKEVFRPEKKATMVVSNVRVDTIRVENADTKPILAEVKLLTASAGKQYEKNIAAISEQIAGLIASDREISARVSGLLLDFHRQTLYSVLAAIDKSEQSLNRNYILSVVGGITSLILILLFLWLIIYDVNKGKEARERLREVMDSRHKMLLSVSHDIKSPLGSILGYLELRKESGDDMQSMHNSARHILALLDNLLEFSGLEQGSLQLSSSTFSVAGLNEEIGQMFMPLAAAKGLTFEFSSEGGRVLSDKMKIQQIAINLVSNAIKYTREGKVSFHTVFSNNHLVIEVTDTGAGIPAGELDKIYEPFSRVESNNALAHGTGLGMYVVKGLVDLLDGNIDVTSRVGKGTRIVVSVPCLPGQFSIRQGAKKIAVYEDDPAVKRMACSMLEQLGHRVVERNYDIILTDLEMGELSGMKVLADAGDVPVVVMTGHEDMTWQKAKELGFDGFVAKPFTLEALREVFGNGEPAAVGAFAVEDDAEIQELFRASTTGHFALLQQALADNDFDKAQAVCHKMLPMFVLLGYPAEELRRMDAQRGQLYEGWKNDVQAILRITV